MKIIKISILILFIFILGSCSNESNNKINMINKETGKEELKKENLKVERVLIEEFKKEINKNNSVIIDLRTISEMKDTGIIKGAKQIDYYSTDFKEQLEKLDKNKKYLIYCRSGNRSSKALFLMKKLGFINVLELQGGMNNWKKSLEETSSFLK